jgi:hypothetical protein
LESVGVLKNPQGSKRETRRSTVNRNDNLALCFFKFLHTTMAWPSEHPCKLPEAKPLQEINLIHPNNVGILKPIEGAEIQGYDWSK